MRIPALALLLAALTSTQLAQADDAPFVDPGVRPGARPQNMVLADLGLHVIGIGLQRTLAPRLAVQVDLDSYTPWTNYPDKVELVGLIVRGRAFVYPLAAAPAGLWLSPFAQYGLGWAKVGGTRDLGSVWAAGASVGYTFLLGRRVALGIGLGGQYHVAHVLGSSGAPSFAGFYPTADANIGYAF